MWRRMYSQFRVGMAGVTGLDYSSIIPMIQLEVNGKKAQKKMFRNIQLVETGYLNGLRENKNN